MHRTGQEGPARISHRSLACPLSLCPRPLALPPCPPHGALHELTHGRFTDLLLSPLLCLSCVSSLLALCQSTVGRCLGRLRPHHLAVLLVDGAANPTHRAPSYDNARGHDPHIIWTRHPPDAFRREARLTLPYEYPTSITPIPHRYPTADPPLQHQHNVNFTTHAQVKHSPSICENI